MNPNRRAITVDIATRILPLLPVVVFFGGLIAWLRYGMDLPYFDDWRSYIENKAGSFGIKYLFTSANDTLYPIGKVLDGLAQRFLDGNSVAYQFFSMTAVLGLLLFLQWRLLSLVLDDQLLIAAAFAFTIFMLQPGSYWGLQNVAYHQAIPLVCILTILWLVLDPKFRQQRIMPLVGFLGMVSGLSYISGAFAILVVAAIFLSFACFLRPKESASLVSAGRILLFTGLVTASLQMWVIVVVQHGHTHRPDTPFAFPVNADFWFYLMGKIGRAALLQKFPDGIALSLVIALIGAILAVGYRVARRTIKGEAPDLSHVHFNIIFIVLSGVIAVYLFLVSAGRANLHGPGVHQPLQIFSLGFERFHFFWVTLLWPWLVAFIFIQDRWRRFASAAALLLVLPLTVLAVQEARGHFEYNKQIALARSKLQITCLQQALFRGGGILCPALYPSDITQAYVNALTKGSSFTRLYPVPESESPRSQKLFQMSRSGEKNWVPNNIISISGADNKFVVAPLPDPQILIHVGPEARKCRILDASMWAAASMPDIIQLFYLKSGQKNFDEADSIRFSLPHLENEQLARVTMRVVSSSGFESDFRLDPGAGYQSITLKDVVLHCALSVAN